ncbi:N-acetyl-1-D-myo-inositol-2-amino-2-deoxy-alpha-D-glucopyranoside deacetylase [Microlunatus sp. GCM10028923]|uniref:N-acetyl-1-D-myo-inositol-2-amino-2-deoxy-alpha- D-glucopyranoside deacetylase n=1 Tax=Microlunatus sp. GCM10028923 TaxID=3273400 RepID=UPI003622ACB2
MTDRRLLLVHAHPDDETLGTGVTMAKYVDEGAKVTLVTCTLGEEGEVLVDSLGHLAAGQEDRLGDHRIGELDGAMEALGVTDYLRLGGDGHYRDSGMLWDENGHATARTELRDGIFWSADLLEAADLLVPIIRDRRPQVLVCYDEFGGYGHPDHVQAHRVAMYAYQLAGVPSYRPDLGEAWQVERVLWSAMSARRMRERIAQLRAAGDTETWKEFETAETPKMVSSDEAIAVEIDGQDYVDRKHAAMKAHATQINLDDPFFTLGGTFGSEVWSREHFRLAAGKPFPGTGWADDLFAGLDA